MKDDTINDAIPGKDVSSSDNLTYETLADGYDNMDDIDSYITGKNVMYTTGEAAEILGTYADRVRYYANDFQEELHIEKSKSGKGAHWRIPAADIERLRTIIQLRKEGRSVSDIKELLNNTNLSFMFENGNKMLTALEMLLKQNNEQIMDNFKKIIEQSQQSMLEDKQKLTSLMESQTEENTLLKQKLLESEEQLKETQKINESLNETVADMNDKIQQLQALIEERLPEKKGLFGFRRK